MRTIQTKISDVPQGKSNWTEIPGNNFSSFSEIWVHLTRFSPFPKIPGNDVPLAAENSGNANRNFSWNKKAPPTSTTNVRTNHIQGSIWKL